MEPSELAQTHWDAIVVGTGIGGATLGYALAHAGWRVLFCEKGRSHLNGAQALRGAYPETLFRRPQMPGAEHRELLAAAGRYWDELEDHSGGQPRAFVPFIGCGTGGSSALYGMAMERFFAADFAEPERWPISYAELEPYYRAAEKLYHVRGDTDPLRGEGSARSALEAPAALSRTGAELFAFLQTKGLHPYRLPLACESVPGCRSCQGWLCDKGCKNDSARICLEPALSRHGALLLSECEVLKLEATANEVTAVVCAWRGQEIRLHGNLVALAAGALETPCLLLESKSAAWPQGLANASGLVGRRLMRHHVDVYLVATRAPSESGLERKELACSDFYHSRDGKLGTVQSFGSMPPAPLLVASLEDDLRHGPIPAAAALLRLARPLVRRALKRMLAARAALATVMEDLPYADNAVQPLPRSGARRGPRAAIHYTIRPEARARISRFRQLMAGLLKPYRFTLIRQAENSRMLAHACGTCRFGDDPDNSVLDANNRAHGLANLYIVDSSFFPSSGGTNPSLTIAANALRVGARLTGAQAR